MDEELRRAKDYVFRLLALCPRTEKELNIKMRNKGFTSDTIDNVIAVIKEYRYIDDAGYAQIWISDRCRMKPMGKRRLYQELYTKGVEKEIINQALTGLTPELEYSMARRIVDRKMAKGRLEPRKMFSFLMRRGFTVEVINKILLEISGETMPE